MWMATKQKFHLMWISMGKSLVKPAPGMFWWHFNDSKAIRDVVNLVHTFQSWHDQTYGTSQEVQRRFMFCCILVIFNCIHIPIITSHRIYMGMIAPVLMKQPWRIAINDFYKFTKIYGVTIKKKWRTKTYIDGFVQERRNSIVSAVELHLSCINPQILSGIYCMYHHEIMHAEDLLKPYKWLNIWRPMKAYVSQVSPHGASCILGSSKQSFDVGAVSWCGAKYIWVLF